MRTVGEVAELRLPDHQRVGLGGGEAVLEAEHRFLRQHRVDDDEIALVLADVLQRDVAALVPALAVLVVQHGVAVREGAATHVLAREAHVIAVREERRIRQRLGHAPVDRRLAGGHLLARLEHPRDGGMDLEACGNAGERLG